MFETPCGLRLIFKFSLSVSFLVIGNLLIFNRLETCQALQVLAKPRLTVQNQVQQQRPLNLRPETRQSSLQLMLRIATSLSDKIGVFRSKIIVDAHDDVTQIEQIDSLASKLVALQVVILEKLKKNFQDGHDSSGPAESPNGDLITVNGSTSPGELVTLSGPPALFWTLQHNLWFIEAQRRNICQLNDGILQGLVAPLDDLHDAFGRLKERIQAVIRATEIGSEQIFDNPAESSRTNINPVSDAVSSLSDAFKQTHYGILDLLNRNFIVCLERGPTVTLKFQEHCDTDMAARIVQKLCEAIAGPGGVLEGGWALLQRVEEDVVEWEKLQRVEEDVVEWEKLQRVEEDVVEWEKELQEFERMTESTGVFISV